MSELLPLCRFVTRNTWWVTAFVGGVLLLEAVPLVVREQQLETEQHSGMIFFLIIY